MVDIGPTPGTVGAVKTLIRRVAVVVVLTLVVSTVAVLTRTTQQPPTAENVDRRPIPVAYALLSSLNAQIASLRLGPTEASRILGYTFLAAAAAHGNDKGYDPELAAAVAGSETAAQLLREATRAQEMRQLVSVYRADKDPELLAYSRDLAAVVVKTANSKRYLSGPSPWSRTQSPTGLPWVPTGRGEPGFEPQWGELDPIIASSTGCSLQSPTAEQVKAEAAQMLDRFDPRAALGADVMWWLSGTGSSTPSGQWLRIVARSAQQQGLTADKALTMLTRAAVAAADAGVLGWREKYRINLARPETVWAELRPGNVPQLPRETPNHPSYPSGHSFFGAAVIGSAKDFLRDGPVGDRLPGDLFVPSEERTWASLDEALAEAGQSRVNAGFHFPMDVAAGQQLGFCIAGHVADGLADALARVRGQVGGR